jgi:Bax protein
MQNAAKNMLGLALLAYAVGCLVLIIYLAHSPIIGIGDEPVVTEDHSMPVLTSSTQLPDFSSIEQTPERKQAFIEILLPLIEKKNSAVLRTRNSIVKLQKQFHEGKELTEKQYDFLERLRERYRVSHEMYPDTAKAFEILLLRADMIPTSMVLAQAAIESGWGTSRFAAEAHNLFGQWCYTPGCGLVPERRPAGARHEVQKFADVEQSLDAYFRNINTHNAYRQLRQLRASLRDQDGALTGDALVAGLARYSSRGAVYIDELRTVIRVNDLENIQLDEQAIETASQP